MELPYLGRNFWAVVRIAQFGSYVEAKLAIVLQDIVSQFYAHAPTLLES